MDANKITQDHINEFLAGAVVDMDPKTKELWDTLSDFERKTIAASAFFFAQGCAQAQRSKTIKKLQWSNRTQSAEG